MTAAMLFFKYSPMASTSEKTQQYIVRVLVASLEHG